MGKGLAGEKFILRSGFLYYTYFRFFQIWFQAFIPTSGLQCYTYVWIENLYLCLVCFIIPSSGLFKFDLRHLYLLLVCNIIPTSVMATSAFAKLDLRHVIPTPGIGKIDIIPLSVISTYGAPYGRPITIGGGEIINGVTSFVSVIHRLIVSDVSVQT